MLSKILMYFYISIFLSSCSFTLRSQVVSQGGAVFITSIVKVFTSLGTVPLALTNMLVE